MTKRIATGIFNQRISTEWFSIKQSVTKRLTTTEHNEISDMYALLILSTSTPCYFTTIKFNLHCIMQIIIYYTVYHLILISAHICYYNFKKANQYLKLGLSVLPCSKHSFVAKQTVPLFIRITRQKYLTFVFISTWLNI